MINDRTFPAKAALTAIALALVSLTGQTTPAAAMTADDHTIWDETPRYYWLDVSFADAATEQKIGRGEAKAAEMVTVTINQWSGFLRN